MIGILFLLAGCSVILKTEGERTAVEYEVVDSRDIPESMKEEIERQKEEPFQIAYRDMKYLYIAEGYGEKEADGYCIEITECAQSESAIYIEAILHGPGGEGIVCETEYPLYVIKMAYTEKHVIFEE